ncbi:hypothetical protein G6F50_014844 [Rhizopus delemar]|uniref:Uncharacterized protein n=1 Tax=Rhizopus delemar TaxID=936053 RepID=A0A9P7C6H0_9FUNG|nr:hypothetical protein G6F50_014844 [Rhizopus delemar]
MRDQQERQAQLLLQVLEQVDDLRAYRDIQRRHGLVRHDQVRTDRQRPRNAHALALPAGKGVRIALGRVGRQANLVDQLGHPVQQVVLALHVRGLVQRAGEHRFPVQRQRLALECHHIDLAGIIDQPQLALRRQQLDDLRVVLIGVGPRPAAGCGRLHGAPPSHTPSPGYPGARRCRSPSAWSASAPAAPGSIRRHRQRRSPAGSGLRRRPRRCAGGRTAVPRR